MIIDAEESITSWLADHRGAKLEIRSEDSDTGHHNRVELTLGEYFLRSRPPDPDRYVSTRELVVRGSGAVRTGWGREPLPLESFEIPLDESTAVGKKNNHLEIYTARNTYSINVH